MTESISKGNLSYIKILNNDILIQSELINFFFFCMELATFSRAIKKKKAIFSKTQFLNYSFIYAYLIFSSYSSHALCFSAYQLESYDNAICVYCWCISLYILEEKNSVFMVFFHAFVLFHVHVYIQKIGNKK